MATLSQRRVTFLWNIRILLLCTHISFMWVVRSKGTFIVQNHEENEVIFVEETITLECRAPGDVSNPQFSLLDSQNNVIVGEGSVGIVDGHLGYPSNGGWNYQIDIDVLSQTRYFCEISGEENFLSREEVKLNVRPRISPVCFVNISTSVKTGDVVGLSCYHELAGVVDSEIKWRQTLRDGTVNEPLPSENSGLINTFKRKFSTYIRASLADDGSEFECVIMDSGSEKTCTSGDITVQQNEQAELMFSPDVIHPLDKRGIAFVTCSFSDSSYDVSWIENKGYDESEVIVSFLGDDTIFVVIPEETTLMSGDVLNFVCIASSGGNTLSKVLTLNVLFASGSSLSPPSTIATTKSTTTQPTQVTLTFSSDSVAPLDRGELRIIECSSSVAAYEISWETNVDDAGAIVTIIGSTIIVSIPTDTTLMSGDVLNFVCLATFNGVTVFRELTLNVLFASATKPSSTTTNAPVPPSRPMISTINVTDQFMTSPMDGSMATTEPQNKNDTDRGNDPGGRINSTPNSTGTDFTIYMIIAMVVAVILVAIIVIILIAICVTKRREYTSQEERKSGNAAYDPDVAEEASVNYTVVHSGKRNNDPGPDVVPYSDVRRKRHVVEIKEDEIYDDFRDWEGSSEL